MADLKLQVVLDFVQRATAPLRGITGGAAKASKAIKETKQQLRDLERAQADVNGYRKALEATQRLSQRWREAQTRATALGKAIAAAGAPTDEQAAQFAKARREAQRLGRQYRTSETDLQGLRKTLAAAGLDTARLATHERTLRRDIAATTKTMQAQQARLDVLSGREKAMGRARAQMGRTQALAAHVTVGGAAALGTGHSLIEAIAPTIEAGKAYQQQVAQFRALGIGDQQLEDAKKWSQSVEIMGASGTEKLKLLKESYSVLRDMHEAQEVTPYLAKLKFGIESVMQAKGDGEGHGEKAEAMFMDLLKVAELRGAAKDPQKLKRVLDYATQAYVSSGGLVKPGDLLHMIKTGGVAAKQLDDTSFFFGLLHTMQEMGGDRTGTGLASAYQNWAAGRSTQQSAEELANLGLLNKGAVKYGTTGHITKLTPDALKDGELYRSNPFEFLMTRVLPKINPHGKLNDQQVVSKLNALFSARKGGDLFASLYLERANIAKQLAAAPRAYGVDALYKEATGGAQGQEADLLAKREDLYRELGTQVLPLYVTALGKVVTMLKAMNRFAQAHPLLAKGLLVTAGSLGVLLTVVGGLMIALGGVLGPLAVVRVALAVMGIQAGAVFGVVGRLAGWLGTGLMAILRGVGSGFAMIGRLFLIFGRFVIANPVVIVIAAIALAAYAIYRNWAAVTTWLGQQWQAIVAVFRGGYEVVAGLFTGDWARMLDGFKTMWGGIGSFWSGVWNGITGTAGAALGWLESKVAGIKAVIDKLTAAWATLRGNNPTASMQPLDWVMPGDREKAHRIAEAIGRTPAGATGDTPTGGAPVVQQTAPIVAGGSARAVHMAGDQVTMHIDARGMDHNQVQAAVRQGLDDHQRAKAARARSAYSED